MNYDVVEPLVQGVEEERDPISAVAGILAENERRNARIGTCFDPLSGRGSTGCRFLLSLADGSEDDGSPLLRELWLPDSMRDLAEVRGLMVAGSVRGYLSGLSGRMATDADVLAFADRFDRLRSLHDFPYWAARHAYIKAKGGGEDRLFYLNRPQRKLVEKLEEFRLSQRPIRLLLLKARQWGGSTCVQIYMAWLQLVHSKGLNSLIIAHQGVASDEIKDMFDRLVASYPLRLLYPPGEMPSKQERKLEGVGRSRSMFRVPQRGCKVKIGTAERPDSCRGGDYNLVHCSEVGIWKATAGKTPEMIVRSACSGVLLRPMTMIVYESTANGTGNFFHREYEAAKRGLSQFEPLFISWFDIDQYSAPLRDPEAFARKLFEGRHCDAAESERAQPGAYLWWLWEKGATLEAINWFVSERSKYSDHGLMASEYPSDDVEAFVHSGCRVFDKYKVEALRAGCRSPLYQGEIDTCIDALPGVIADDRMRRRQLADVAFTPLAGGAGGWKIWRLPEETPGWRTEGRYVAVVDVGGRGAKSDWSVIAVFDREPMTRGEGPEIVAQWRGHTDFDLLAWKAALGASFYDDALLVIESNTLETRDRDRQTDGDQSAFLLNRLREVYPNLYARRQSEEDVRQGVPCKYGFHTNVATKPLIIATLVKTIREGLYTEREEGCLDELLQYERKQNGSFGAIAGCHDDMLMTRAIGLHICLHEMEPPRRVCARSVSRGAPVSSSLASW